MRFLVDANVSPRLAEMPNAAGHEAVAVRDLASSDDEIPDRLLPVRGDADRQ
ncbi:MAG: DUF5615 family PIN-like protein [Acidimicrobiales bacterium]